MLLTAGQRGDSPQFIPVLERIRVPRPAGGRPRTRPDRVLADKAYTSKASRAYLRQRGIKATIPSKADQDAHRRAKESKGGPPSILLSSQTHMIVRAAALTSPTQPRHQNLGGQPLVTAVPIHLRTIG
jgi:hypothetical protein